MNYSYQRQVVLETLRARHRHLTARELYEAARKDCPRLSLGTVYRNLNTLVETGQAGRVTVPGQADRYDWETKPHHHFYCRACQGVQNITLDTAALESALSGCRGVQVEGYDLLVTGLCAGCAGKAEE